MQRRISNIEIEDEDDGGRGHESQFEGRSSGGTVSMNGDDNVYVGVGKGDSSMDALRWALDNLITSSSTLVFLIHVFPESHYIPYPLGRLAKDQASQEQWESFMSQEREKRRALLLKFLQVCSASKVKVETILVESDSVAKALQDLITILNIKKLVLGINKSNAWKGKSVPERIMRSSASDTCEVKVICGGEEIKIEEATTKRSIPKSPKEQHHRKKDQSIGPFACICFLSKPKINS